MLIPGDPLPRFRAWHPDNPHYAVDSAAGRYLAIAVLSGADDATVEREVERARANRARFNDVHASLFVLMPDTPEWRDRVRDEVPGLRWLFDDGTARKALQVEADVRWIVSDPALRVMGLAGPDEADRLLGQIGALPPPERHAGASTPAPVLVLPRVFEPELCQALIAHYEAVGGEESGFMREIDGKTRLVNDARHKKRSDVMLETPDLIGATRARISRRLAPMVEKAFQFKPTRIERYLVACYDASTGGYFRPHRDNTTAGTAHRRFAVSINLNHDFSGGDLRFPEFGPQTYRPPLGGAVVFSCSLLHEATAVTKGRRYAFLPFLYDEAAAKVREENMRFVEA